MSYRNFDDNYTRISGVYHWSYNVSKTCFSTGVVECIWLFFMINKRINNNDSVFQDFDESFAERVWGLTEMFPERLRTGSANAVSSSVSLVKGKLIIHGLIYQSFFFLSFLFLA